MLRLNQNGKDWFTITDDAGGQASATGEELNGLYQQLIKIKDGLPQEKENTHIVILDDDYTKEKIQMELSDSAYKLLCYLYEKDWFDSYLGFTEIDKKNFERFL